MEGADLTPPVSVVVPCRNEAEFIEQLLDAVHVQTVQPREIIVVDNGSTDASAGIVEAYAARHGEVPVRLIACTGEGTAAAMNAGIAAAAGEVIVRLDAHSRPQPDYIERCLARLAEPGAGVVGGVWHVAPGGSLRSRAIAVAVSSKLGSGGAAYRHADAHPAPKDADTVPFGCYTKDLWRRLNGYDESLLVVEDGDFNYRVRQAGLRVILDPAIRTTYFARRRFRTLGRQYLRYGWWKIPMLLRHPGAVRVRQLIPLAFVTVFLTLAFASIWSVMALAALFVLLALYGSAVVFSGAHAAARASDWRLALPIAAAFVVIHFAWGLGGLLHLVTFGQYPRWRLRKVRRAAAVA